MDDPSEARAEAPKGAASSAVREFTATVPRGAVAGCFNS
jgi:hypothetical protein